MRHIYTTAPAALDATRTRTLREAAGLDGDGRVVRLVKVHERQWKAQTLSYWKAGHLAMTAEEWRRLADSLMSEDARNRTLTALLAGKEISVAGDGALDYIVTRSSRGLNCTCPAWGCHTTPGEWRTCKHIARLLTSLRVTAEEMGALLARDAHGGKPVS